MSYYREPEDLTFESGTDDDDEERSINRSDLKALWHDLGMSERSFSRAIGLSRTTLQRHIKQNWEFARIGWLRTMAANLGATLEIKVTLDDGRTYYL